MERAVFISVITSNNTEEQVIEYLDELEFLAETAGVVGERRFVQRLDRPNSKTYIGTGKLEEVKAFIIENEIDLVIFLRDPYNPKSHEPDVNTVVKLCDMHNIPLATNLASAELLIKALDRGDLEWREIFR